MNRFGNKDAEGADLIDPDSTSCWRNTTLLTNNQREYILKLKTPPRADSPQYMTVTYNF